MRRLDYFSFVPRRRPPRLDVRPNKRSINFSQQIWKRQGDQGKKEGAQTRRFFFCARRRLRDLDVRDLESSASKFGKDEIKGREKVRKLDIFLLCPAVARPDLTFARTRDL